MSRVRVRPSGSFQVDPLRLGYVLLTLVLAVAGCGILAPQPNPEPDRNAAQQAAAALAAGLSAKDLSPVPFLDASGAAVNDLFQPLVSGMGPVKPNVTVASVSRDGSSATAKLSFSWTFAGVPAQWTYPTEARLTNDGGVWKTSWHPSIVQPQLDGTNRLSQRRRYPERGELLGEDGAPIVVVRAVFRIGIDKSKVSGQTARSSAVRLAKLGQDQLEGVREEGGCRRQQRFRSSHCAAHGCAGRATRLRDPCHPGSALHQDWPDACPHQQLCETHHRDRR